MTLASSDAGVTCPHCRAHYAAGAAFCESCGKALPSAVASGPRVVSADAMSQTAAGQRIVGDELVKPQKKGATALLWVAILQTLVGPVMLLAQKAKMERENPGTTFQILPVAWVTIFGIAIAFWALYFWARRSPLPAAIVGLVLFITLHVIDAIADPAQLATGWLLKIIVIVALAKAIEAGMKHKRLLAETGAA